MELGIAGKWPWCGGPSKGLGFGYVRALAAKGVHLVVTARSVRALRESTAHLREAALDQVMQQRHRGGPAGRVGTPQEFGTF